MKIRNNQLPMSLQGKNNPTYEHNLDNYRGKRFTMELANGNKMPVHEWLIDVQCWLKANEDKHAALGIQTYNEKGESIMDRHGRELFRMSPNVKEVTLTGDPSELRALLEKLSSSPATTTIMAAQVTNVVPVNATFFDYDDICVVEWSDGTKTRVIWDGEGDSSQELALAIAFIKRFFGLKMYDMLLASVGKRDREIEATEIAAEEAREAEEADRARRYRKAVKNAAKRLRKAAQFAADVENELNNEFE